MTRQVEYKQFRRFDEKQRQMKIVVLVPQAYVKVRGYLEFPFKEEEKIVNNEIQITVNIKHLHTRLMMDHITQLSVKIACNLKEDNSLSN